MESEATSDDDQRAREWRQSQTRAPSSTGVVQVRHAPTLASTHPRRPVVLPPVTYDAAPSSPTSGRPRGSSSSPGRPDVPETRGGGAEFGRPAVPASSASSPIGTEAGRPDVGSAASEPDPFGQAVDSFCDSMGFDADQRKKFEGLVDLFNVFGPKT